MVWAAHQGDLGRASSRAGRGARHAPAPNRRACPIRKRRRARSCPPHSVGWALRRDGGSCRSQPSAAPGSPGSSSGSAGSSGPVSVPADSARSGRQWPPWVGPSSGRTGAADALLARTAGATFDRSLSLLHALARSRRLLRLDAGPGVDATRRDAVGVDDGEHVDSSPPAMRPMGEMSGVVSMYVMNAPKTMPNCMMTPLPGAPLNTWPLPGITNAISVTNHTGRGFLRPPLGAGPWRPRAPCPSSRDLLAAPACARYPRNDADGLQHQLGCHRSPRGKSAERSTL